MSDPRIDGFLAYIEQRGIPERYHALYRDEVLSVLLQSGVGSMQRLTPEDLHESIRAAERVLKNRKAVCAALEQYLQVLQKPGSKSRRPPPRAPAHDTVPDSVRNSSAFPPPGAGDKRRYVRVPFNREVQMEGSVATIRSSDLSLGGMYLESRQGLKSGEVIEIAFRLRPNDRRPVVTNAEVVYVDPGMGVGVDFVDMGADVAREVRHFIEDIIAGRQF